MKVADLNGSEDNVFFHLPCITKKIKAQMRGTISGLHTWLFCNKSMFFLVEYLFIYLLLIFYFFLILPFNIGFLLNFIILYKVDYESLFIFFII